MMAAHWHGFMRFCCLRSGGRARAAGTGAAVVATFGLQQGSRVGRWGLVGVFIWRGGTACEASRWWSESGVECKLLPFQSSLARLGVLIEPENW